MIEKHGEFIERHIGPRESEIAEMLSALGQKSLAAFIDAVVPQQIRTQKPLSLSPFPVALSEKSALSRLSKLADKNKVFASYIGCGYYDTITPGVIQRNILENPGWYTQYTPYQAEIAQGRLEALLNFQTLIAELTGLPIANASLLDEATAAAEAMTMSEALVNKDGSFRKKFFVAKDAHPQNIALLKTRGEPLGIELIIENPENWIFDSETFGCFLQYPNTYGEIVDYSDLAMKAHKAGALVTVSADPLALVLLESPGKWGADIVVGSAQRFGVPLGFGGPHAAFFATKDEYKRSIPGRLVGVSKDSRGKPALRLSLQTREQHIRREKATSNICTAQVLLAVMAGMYAVYHGPKGLKQIASGVNELAVNFVASLKKHGVKVKTEKFFDTIIIQSDAKSIKSFHDSAKLHGINLRDLGAEAVGVSFDEGKTEEDLRTLLQVFGAAHISGAAPSIPVALARKEAILTQKVFNTYHSETEFLRYVRSLEAKDLSLCFSMIPLGSCTMKLNATSEMFPVSWPEFSRIHPFAPRDQFQGYLELFHDLEVSLAEITGFAKTSLQPNAGSQGEYAGLLVIRAYHESRGEKRKICLIPRSAHGTNPASAAMVGYTVVPVACDTLGNIDVQDLEKQLSEHGKQVACLMVTYPSTHGVFEEHIKEITDRVHQAGAQVYLDGANLNALVGLVKPGELGADVCHINLHKTFCIPHGGGGPGMGPICVAKQLAPFLPGHPLATFDHASAIGPVSAAPWGSSSILVIPWMYMAMMAGSGLTKATEVAILNANYIAQRLKDAYPALYRGKSGFVAHECILDLRDLKSTSGIEVDDVAKRLIDYGFHAPTVSWPVAGTVMVEPTESESKAELDKFCEAMLQIKTEADLVRDGKFDKINNPLKNAPHTSDVVISDDWQRPYSREIAAFPTEETRSRKFWPAVGRIDGVYGDKNLFCTCDGFREESE